VQANATDNVGVTKVESYLDNALEATSSAAPHLGIGSTEEVLATFSDEVADRHRPTGPTTDVAGLE
jgi:hypothetical protein